MWDFNTDMLVHYDVLPYLRKECVTKKAPNDYEEFKKFVERKSMCMYWSRCEYEMIIHGWPMKKNTYKIDVHEQVIMNLDIIAQILWEELPKSKK